MREAQTQGMTAARPCEPSESRPHGLQGCIGWQRATAVCMRDMSLSRRTTAAAPCLRFDVATELTAY